MLLLTGAGIFNTLFVSVMERLREFGILLAIGFSPGRLFRLVLWESLWLALSGVIAGLLLLAVPYYLLATKGIDIAKLSAGKPLEISGIAASTKLLAGIYPENFMIIVAVIIGATLFSGLYPAMRAGRVAPVDAIKLV
jgi:ABC-type lipoprotein release transport system permease subunit